MVTTEIIVCEHCFLYFVTFAKLHTVYVTQSVKTQHNDAFLVIDIFASVCSTAVCT